MRIDGNIITAEEGRALHMVGTPAPTTVTRVSLASSASADDWEDCDYGEREVTDMRYSVRSIIREVRKLGLYDQFRALLEQSRRDWDFIGANYIASDDEDFLAMSDALVSSGIITRKALDEMLLRCVWSAE